MSRAAGGDDTIFALSSGAPPAAVAVVRVSGPQARAAVTHLVGRVPPPRQARLATLRDAAGKPLDEALLLWFPGPGSATGEDVVEFHLHGGRATVAAVLAALASLEGCRPAEPGEFTRRAFGNGRIDLLQAEGLADLLAAETEAERRRALGVAGGTLSREVERWRDALLAIAARIEAFVEFGDDEADVVADDTIHVDLAGLRQDIESALRRPPPERLRDGARVVIAGPPNVGKSSLLNRLAGRDAAIVADVAGTTRDLLEVPVRAGEQAWLLIDGAGLRAAADPVERIGVARAEAAMAAADVLLWLGEPDACPPIERTIVVHPRADLPGRGDLPDGADIKVSATSGEGLDELRDHIDRAVGQLGASGMDAAFDQRQRELIREIAARLSYCSDVDDPLLVAEEVRAALVAADRLLGHAGVEDMLDRLFGRFCIGK